MAAYGNFPDQIRTRSHKLSDQEKCRAHGVAIEQIEQSRSDGRIWAIIECERERLCGCSMPHGGAEQLRRGTDSSPGSDARGGHRASRHNNGPGVQFVSTLFDFRTAWPGIPAADWVTIAGRGTSKGSSVS